MNILLLEDELMLQNSICEYLEELKHNVICFSDGIDAKSSLEDNTYDLMILDINVPSLNGLDLCKHLQEQNINTAKIFISALVDIEYISQAFNLGALDYIKKPFHLKELAIRIEKISNDLNSKTINHIILSDNYTYNKSNKELFFNNILQDLTKKQIAIIDFMCSNINSITSYEMLRIYVWNNDNIGDATIRTEISRLRKTLKEDFILNQKGLGYKISKHTIKL